MTLDTTSTPTKSGNQATPTNSSSSNHHYQSTSSTPNVIKKSRNEVIKTIQEITDFDEVTINRAIEACQDSEGRYSMDTVLNILMDEKYSNEHKSQRDTNKSQNERIQRQYGVSPSSNDDSNKYLSPLAKGSGGASASGDRNNDGYGPSNNIEEEDEDDYEQIANYVSSQNNQGPTQPKLPESNLLREEGKPAGLKNLGNTCWFNSIIQALFHLPGFRQIIFSFQLESTTDLNKLDDNSRNMLQFVAELRKLFALMLKSKRKVINPSQTLKCLKNCSKYDAELFNQEDVSEFTTILVNIIEESFNILYNLKHQQQQQQQQQPKEDLLAAKLNESLNLNKDSQLTPSNEQSELNATKIPVENKINVTDNNSNNPAKLQLNIKKNRSNPIVNLLNGDILVNRKNPDEAVVNVITEIFREVNIQMLNSRNLHAGLELEWGETSIDKHITPASPLSSLASLNPSLSASSQQENKQTTTDSANIQMNRSFYEQESWIKTLPRVLFICLNRYKFVKATKSSSKILEPFEFYQHIYLDRYMDINKEIIKVKRKELKILRADLKNLQDKLNSIKDYKFDSETANSYALDDVFKCVLHFVKTDYSLNDVFEKIKPINNTSNIDLSNETSVQERDRLNIVESCLKNWIKKTESKIDELKSSINIIKDKINTMFDDENLKKYKYNLHSVCIHEGTSTSGHFWTYIWNPKQSKWYKYNDTEVCETTWDDVYANSVGGSKLISTNKTLNNQNSNSNKCNSGKISSSSNNSTNENNQLNDLSSCKNVNLPVINKFSSQTSNNETNTDSSVCEPKQNDRIPSAYFLIYIKADDSSLYQETNDFDSDLQKLLKNDQETLENQLNTLRYKLILNDTIETLKKSNALITQVVQNSSINSEQNNQTCTEHAKAFSESTNDALTSSFDRIQITPNKTSNGSYVLDHTAAEDALKNAIEIELSKYSNTKKEIEEKLPDSDIRINHILIYFNANGLSIELKTLAVLDIFRIQIFPDNDLRLKILQNLAQIKYNEYVIASVTSSSTSSTSSSVTASPSQSQPLIKVYEKYLNEYRDFRSIIAAFINAGMLMESQRFEDATPFFCVACEYNERITSYTNFKLKGMDHEFLLANRRKCLKLWNQSTIRKFAYKNSRSTDVEALNLNQTNSQQLNQQELNTLIDTMINKFLPCFFRLATSTPEDKAMIEEIRQDWLNVLDSNLPGLQIFHDFMGKLFEEPSANHYHSLNVNKQNLSNRYKDMVQLVKKL